MTSTANPEQKIRATIDERAAAIRAKQPGPLVAGQADEVVTLDLLPPLNARGKDAVAEKNAMSSLAWISSCWTS